MYMGEATCLRAYSISICVHLSRYAGVPKRVSYH